MKRFLIKILISITAVVLIMLIGITITSTIVKNRNFNNGQTESNTLFIQSDRHYDFGMMGISHARNFSRHGNHERFQNIFSSSLINLGQGRGKCGINEQLFYLQYAYSRNIQIDTMLYILSPPMVFGDYLNKASHTFEEEVFEWAFLYQYLQFDGDNKRERIFSYLRHKLHPDWWLMKPGSSTEKTDALTEIDEEEVQRGFIAAMKDTNLEMSFEKNVELVIKTLELCKKNQTEVVFIIPPALFGQWPGHKKCDSLSKAFIEEYNISYFDFSESILEPELYYDHHHLNTPGVLEFLEKHLKPSLRN